MSLRVEVIAVEGALRGIEETQGRIRVVSVTSRGAAAESIVLETSGVLRLVEDDPAALRLLQTGSETVRRDAGGNAG